MSRRLFEAVTGPKADWWLVQTLGGWESDHDKCHHAMRKLIGMGHEHDPNAPAADEGSGGGH